MLNIHKNRLHTKHRDDIIDVTKFECVNKQGLANQLSAFLQIAEKRSFVLFGTFFHKLLLKAMSHLQQKLCNKNLQQKSRLTSAQQLYNTC